MKKRFLKFSHAPKIQSRAMRLRSFTNVAYKDDGDGILELVDKKLTEFKAATSKESADKAIVEVKALIEEERKSFTTKWEESQSEFKSQGATIKQLLEEQKEMK